MRGLTLTQPWATLVASGEKRIETRSWPTSYRGPLAIHAAKGFPRGARDLCLLEPFVSALSRSGHQGIGSALVPRSQADPAMALPLGAFVAVCDLYAVMATEEAPLLDLPLDERERAFGDFTPGRYAWVLTDVRKLERPVPARGALGLWTPGETDAAALAEAR